MSTLRPRRRRRLLVQLLIVLLAIAVIASAIGLLAPTAAAGAPTTSGQGVDADQSATSGGLVEQQLDSLNPAELEQFIAELNSEMSGAMPEFSLRDVLSGLTGQGFKANAQALLNGLGRLFCRELLANASLLGKLIVLAVLCALLQNLQTAFESESVGKVAYAVCFLVVAAIGIGAFAGAVRTAQAVITSLVRFMQILTPLLLTLLAALGGITSAPLFQGIVVVIINIVAVAVRDVILPLLLAAALVDAVGNLISGWRLSDLVAFLRQAATVALGVLLCAFVGIMLANAAVGTVGDGVALRTAKYAANTFVPVVGKMFADSAELVIGGSLILKNAVGITGTVAIFLVCAVPLIKLIAMILTFRFAAALIQPVNPGRISECLNGLATSLNLVCVAVGAVAMMFFFSTAIIVAAGNVMTMLR